MQLTAEERRALVVIAALLVLAAGARWVERPRPLLEDAVPVDLDALEQASRDARPAPRAAGGGRPDAKVDPNRATAAELMTLPGVGQALAARIIAERERAPFTSAADMQRVSGIGTALSQRLAPRVTLQRESPAAVRPPQPRAAPAMAPQRARPVDLSRATAAELERLSGVGPVLAARLIARRDSLGGFGSWEEVDGVTGVGPALLARLRETAILRQTP